MSLLIRGDSGSELYLQRAFRYVSDKNYVKNTFDRIKANLPIGPINSINIYLNALAKFSNGSNNIDTTTWQLKNIKIYLSQFSGYISNYNNRIRTFVIPRLSRLIYRENEIIATLKSVGNGNGNRIWIKYDNIKQKVRYCESSLKFELQRLDSISNNAKMLQFHLGKIIGILNNYNSNVKKLKEKLENMKKKKKIALSHLTSVARSIEENLGKIRCISNCLNSFRGRVSITTIIQDIAHVNSEIQKINNILYDIKSWLIVLDPINLGIDLSIICEIELCIKDFVCEIHRKYYCLSSTLTQINDGAPGATLGLCQLSKIAECRCTGQKGPNTCQPCQPNSECQSCQLCQSLKQLLTTTCQSNFGQKLGSIKNVICRLTDNKRVDGCPGTQKNQCAHDCQYGQQGQTNTTCQSTSKEGSSSNSCQETNVSQLITCTLGEITKCQSPLVKCESNEEVKCENPAKSSCQTTPGAQPPASCPSDIKDGKCDELGKLKLCIDTLVNNCNCEMFKQMLKDKKINSCIDVFRCLIITNFRILFCFYISFDKSILDQISSSINKLVEIKSFILNKSRFEFIIKCKINGIKNQINESIKKVESLENTMKSGIRELECAIEGLQRNFIQSTINNITEC